MMNYVIVGNSIAAIGTAEGIRSVDTKGSITLISDESYHTYARPLIADHLSGKVPLTKMFYRPKDYYERLDITPRLGERVSALRLAEKTVVLESGEEIPYDRLMLATGGKPIVPPISGRDLEGVHTFIKWDDVIDLGKVLLQGSRIVVIGAGLSGLKAAEALIKCGVDVTVVEQANHIMSSVLDETSAAIVQKTLESHGVKFCLNTTVTEIIGFQRSVSGVCFHNATIHPCEQVVIALGVCPNTDLAEGTKICIDRGIVVDEHMRTNVTDVYAAGDAAEGYDSLYRERRILPISPNAYKQGFNGGLNMTGKVRPFSGSFATISVGLFDLPMITSGIVKPEGEGFSELIDLDPLKSYQKLVIREGRIVGFIAIKKVERAGIFSELIKNELYVGDFQKNLLKPDFDFGAFHRDNG
jgi:NAD(P)H-nitrite reductase large subunit